MFDGDLFIVCIVIALLGLPCGLVSGLDGIDILYDMPRWILLRNNRSHISYWKLLSGIVFCCVCEYVFKLFFWFKSEQFGVDKLFRLRNRNLLTTFGCFKL